MGKELEKEKTVIIDDPMTPVPLNQRQHWTAPAFIFGGLEFSVTLLMIGSTLIGAFGLKGIIPVVLFTFICLTWVGNAISGYMGAKTGLSSSVIAKQGFGDKQAKFIIALVIGVISMGWWAVQTSVTGNAFCAVLGIDGRILAFSKQQKSTQIDLLCAECKRRLADQTRTCLCHIALRHLRKRAEQEITRYHFQHRVA